jgi:hypothetical protein
MWRFLERNKGVLTTLDVAPTRRLANILINALSLANNLISTRLHRSNKVNRVREMEIHITSRVAGPTIHSHILKHLFPLSNIPIQPVNERLNLPLHRLLNPIAKLV